jgi:hypothetical protein
MDEKENFQVFLFCFNGWSIINQAITWKTTHKLHVAENYSRQKFCVVLKDGK